MLVMSFAVITLVVTGVLVYYLRTVPEGPECPRCGSILQRLETTALERPMSSPVRRWTDAARCAVCGWDGRLRRSPHPELARTKRTEHRRGKP